MRAALEPSSHPFLWPWPAAVGVGLLYYAGAQLGLALTFAPGAVPVVWPPHALMLVALLMSAPKWWWRLLAAAFPAHMLLQLQGGVPATMALCSFISTVSGVLVGALLNARLGSSGPALRSAHSVLAFICAAAVAAFLSAILDATFIRAIGWGGASGDALWQARFFAYLLASIVFVPALLTISEGGAGEAMRQLHQRVTEGAILALGLVASGAIALNAGPNDPFLPALVYLPAPFLVWMALRFGASFACLAYFAVAALVIFGLLHGQVAMQGPIERAALPIQLFLLAVGLPLLLVAGMVEDLRGLEANLRNWRALVGAALRSAPDGLAISRSTDGSVIEANERWMDLMRKDATSIQAVAAPQASSRGQMFAPAGAGDHPARSAEVSLLDRHGRSCVVQLSTVPVVLDGQACDISVARDMTAQRDAEREVQEQRGQLMRLTRMASLTDFSGTLAHELNQPLTAILSNAQAALRMLSAAAPNLPEVRVILRDISEADKRAGVLIHHLRLLMKNSDEEFVRLDANHLVKEVLALVQGEFLLRKVELKTSFCGDLPHVHGDPVQLQQLLLNLVLNAFDAMQGSTHPERVLGVDTLHGAVGTVQIVVSDTGTGIPKAVLDRVFDPLYTTKPNGLGLGLSICRKIAASHGGTLSARSEQGCGASFRCTLPAERPLPRDGRRAHAGEHQAPGNQQPDRRRMTSSTA